MELNHNHDPAPSNPNYNYECLTRRLLNYVTLLNAFRLIKIALYRILCRSNKNYNSSTCSSPKSQVFRPEYSKITRFLFMRFRLVTQIEKKYITKYITQGRVTNLISKRSINIEMNTIEFWSVNSE